jgi:uncharacterized membrane protein YeaQ/YmgE (transglycosylase-associated protein family)
MNVVLWVLAGGLAGWVGFKYIGANENRGMVISVIIGMVGGFAGGNVLAPLLGETAPMPDAISLFALIMALASAAVCLTIGDMISKRFDI